MTVSWRKLEVRTGDPSCVTVLRIACYLSEGTFVRCVEYHTIRNLF
jgi:hypothetical protein